MKDNALWKLHPLDVAQDDRVFGLVYPGFRRCLSWAYVTIGPNAVVLSQPWDHHHTGTSITHIWSQRFIAQLLRLAKLGAAVNLYEHYYGEEPRLERVKLSAAGEIKWRHIAHTPREVADAFSSIVGHPIPDFAALTWGPSMSSDAAQEQWQQACRAIDEETVIHAARCPRCGKMVVVPREATPAEMHRLIHGDEPCRPTL